MRTRGNGDFAKIKEIRMISIHCTVHKKNGHLMGEKMESSKRYILQAEVEYWHEMLRINRNILSEKAKSEMRLLLKNALLQLNGVQDLNQKAAA